MPRRLLPAYASPRMDKLFLRTRRFGSKSALANAHSFEEHTAQKWRNLAVTIPVMPLTGHCLGGASVWIIPDPCMSNAESGPHCLACSRVVSPRGRQIFGYAARIEIEVKLTTARPRKARVLLIHHPASEKLPCGTNWKEDRLLWLLKYRLTARYLQLP